MWIRIGLSLLFTTGMAASASAQSVYPGVTPGKDVVPNHLLGKPGQTPPVVTWPGFQKGPDDSGTVFVQLTSEINPTITQKPGKVLVRLPQAKLPGRNSRRPLYTKHFGTPVHKIQAKRRKGGVVLELAVSQGATAKLRTQKSSSGYVFVFVDVTK